MRQRSGHSPLTTSTISAATYATDEMAAQALQYARRINMNTLKLKSLRALYQNAVAKRRLRALASELEQRTLYENKVRALCAWIEVYSRRLQRRRCVDWFASRREQKIRSNVLGAWRYHAIQSAWTAAAIRSNVWAVRCLELIAGGCLPRQDKRHQMTIAAQSQTIKLHVFNVMKIRSSKLPHSKLREFKRRRAFNKLEEVFAAW